MKIALFTEMNFRGKINRTHTNMRTEFAWMVALDADHYNLNDNVSQKYDLGIGTVSNQTVKSGFINFLEVSYRYSPTKMAVLAHISTPVAIALSIVVPYGPVFSSIITPLISLANGSARVVFPLPGTPNINIRIIHSIKKG